MTDNELTWLAGWLEGEGSFFSAKRWTTVAVQAFSIDRDIIEHVVKITGATKIYYIKPRKHPDGWTSKEGWRFHLESEPAVALMKQLLPLMRSQRRREQIARVLEEWDNRPNKPVEKECACGCGRKIVAGCRRLYADSTTVNGKSACATRAFRQRKKAA